MTSIAINVLNFIYLKCEFDGSLHVKTCILPTTSRAMEGIQLLDIARKILQIRTQMFVVANLAFLTSQVSKGIAKKLTWLTSIRMWWQNYSASLVKPLGTAQMHFATLTHITVPPLPAIH